MKHSPEQLDLARRAWLEGLAREHAIHGTAATALPLARGQYLCGEYDAALESFVAARDLAPDDPDAHLALIRMASATGRRELEDAALERALRRLPISAPIALHAALRDVPRDIDAALRRLQPFAGDATCMEFGQALAAVRDGTPLPPVPDGDARARARRESLLWVHGHMPGPEVLCGMPVAVLLRALETAPESGLALECGVYFGRSIRLIAERSPGAVHGFDSFQGLPEAWSPSEGAGAYSTAGRLPAVPDNVRLHVGWFEETLPRFFEAHDGPIRLLHVDCDLYSSTRTVLTAANERLVSGSVIVFDDLLGYPGYENHELRAFEEFADSHGVEWELVAAALLGREVAVRITGRGLRRTSVDDTDGPDVGGAHG